MTILICILSLCLCYLIARFCYPFTSKLSITIGRPATLKKWDIITMKTKDNCIVIGAGKHANNNWAVYPLFVLKSRKYKWLSKVDIAFIKMWCWFREK